MSPRSRKRAREIASWMCLLAVALMYAPLAGAVLVAHGMDCCTGGYCKIPGHHHQHERQQTAERQAPIPHSDGMNCAHETGGMALTSCSMTCCQDPSQSALMPVTFVLPTAALAPESGVSLRPVQAAADAKISRFTTPLPPPPRSFSPAL